MLTIFVIQWSVGFSDVQKWKLAMETSEHFYTNLSNMSSSFDHDVGIPESLPHVGIHILMICILPV